MLVSLLQPPPEVFHLFDDVMMLAEGASSRSSCIVKQNRKSVSPQRRKPEDTLVREHAARCQSTQHVWCGFGGVRRSTSLLGTTGWFSGRVKHGDAPAQA